MNSQNLSRELHPARTQIRRSICLIVLSALAWSFICATAPAAKVRFSGEKKLNNLTSVLLEITDVTRTSKPYAFQRSRDGWIQIATAWKGTGTVKLILDPGTPGATGFLYSIENDRPEEAVRHLTRGEHKIQIECSGKARVNSLLIKAIPELIHCGLGFDPQIKSYGHYDMNFLQRDVLPNVTTLIVPHNIQLPQAAIDDWHRQGKKFVAETGVPSDAKTSEDHFKYWTSFFEKSAFIDGIIIDEFIVNNPSTRPGGTVSPERQKRMEQEQQRHHVYEDALKQMHADPRFKEKMVYAYIGGSGKKLNQEMIGTNFIRTILDCGYQIALERYLHEMSSESRSQEALQMFIDGIADWKAKEPGVQNQLILAFGLFSMPPGGINKQPNVDYHVWMDQQMNIVANHPVMAGIGGIEWWTSSLADEETVRFVGRLYRHYALEGKTNLFTHDPLFLPHIQNADFENGTNHWTLQPAQDGSIDVKRFPRYGRIEGRFMGLGRPADPEHIGDTFLWMKRSDKGPNTFSQTIKDLQPGRLYSMKMFSCDYSDLINSKTKKAEEANRFIGKVVLEGVDLDQKRSFTEMYASNPEPKIPVWITYHWKVFRAKARTAQLQVSDWPDERIPNDPFGQEQTFNFLEIQPYWE